MTHSPLKTLAIIGGGFSGTALATRLLRAGYAGHVVLVERGAEVGRGIAYARRDHDYLLNAPAGQMSADPARAAEFVEFARRHLPGAEGHDYLPRALYGDYMVERLHEARSSAGGRTQLTVARGEVHGLRRATHGRLWELTLDDGSALAVSDVVLATGHPPQAAGRNETAGNEDPLAADPWSQVDQMDSARSILFVGTGLTMCDLAIRAAHGGQTPPRMHAISRHGLLPQHQQGFKALGNLHGAELLEAAGRSSRDLVRAVRRLARQANDAGGDWREVITLVREGAGPLWERLSEPERARFLRHAQAQWKTHRHRMPPPVAAEITRLRDSGALQVHAARPMRLDRAGSGFRAAWQPRGGGDLVEVTVDMVVNCGGPDYRVRRSPEPLMRSLLEQKFVSADALELGIRTDAHGGVFGTDNQLVPGLHYVGPLLRADYWEATAVPELRAHIERLAGALTP